MNYYLHDPDEHETVVVNRPCGSCGDDMRKCDGRCSGSTSIGSRRRSPEEIKKIKADRQRDHEDRILAEAIAILLRRQR